MRRLPLGLFLSVLLLACSVTPSVADDPPAPFSDERARFSVQVGDLTIPYRVMGLFVMPGERVPLNAKANAFSTISTRTRFTMDAPHGVLRSTGLRAWQWTAPDTPGLYPLTITDAASNERIRLNVFVMTPYDHRARRIGAFRIGHYRRKPLRDNPIYERPKGFIQLTEANRAARVSPHFTLEQFACKQTSDYPQYLLLREELLLKLEALLQAVNERGVATHTLHVMSGFRTPHYNRAIGNRTDYSRHLYGGAADVFVDTDEDGYMDDVTGDGASNRADAEWLARRVESLQRSADAPDIGGLGVYGPAPHRGPFVHVDARGYRARW
jgi:hypothetical protein